MFSLSQNLKGHSSGRLLLAACWELFGALCATERKACLGIQSTCSLEAGLGQQSMSHSFGITLGLAEEVHVREAGLPGSRSMASSLKPSRKNKLPPSSNSERWWGWWVIRQEWHVSSMSELLKENQAFGATLSSCNAWFISMRQGGEDFMHSFIHFKNIQ